MGLLKNVAGCGCGFEAVLEEAVTAYKGLLTSGMGKKNVLVRHRDINMGNLSSFSCAGSGI